jgi:hypothetical protein
VTFQERPTLGELVVVQEMAAASIDFRDGDPVIYGVKFTGQRTTGPDTREYVESDIYVMDLGDTARFLVALTAAVAESGRSNELKAAMRTLIRGKAE